MKTIIAVTLSLVVLFSINAPLHAESDENKPIKERRERVREKIRENIQKNFPRAALGTGKLTAINGSTLTVDKDGKSYNVNTGTFDKCTTKFKRRFGGDSNTSEMSVGDIVNVIGYFTNEEKTTINACLIRDTSIQKRRGGFIGKVVSLTDTGWVMTTLSQKKANQTVTVDSSTKFIDRRGQTISKTDIVVGHRVRIKGLWNNDNNTVTEVTHVKDFSLPEKPTLTPEP